MAVNGNESNWHDVTSGIQQGLVLELFVLYINDLPYLNKSNTFLFGDEVTIFRLIMNRTDHRLLQQIMTILDQWSDDWML